MQKRPGIVISFPNQKGGVAKSTNAINIAAATAHKGHKTLLLDLDFQGNSSANIGIKKMAILTDKTIAAGLIEENKTAAQCVITTKFKNLDAIAADIDFCEFHDVKNSSPGSHLLLLDWIEPIRYQYDYIYIDVHPDLQLPFQNAMVASDYYIIPLFAEPDAVDGLHLMFAKLSIIKDKLNPSLFFLGSIISKYNKKNATHGKYLRKLQEFGKEHTIPMIGVVRESTAVAGASDARSPLLHYKPHLDIVEDYDELTDKILARATRTRRGRSPKTPSVKKADVLKFMDTGAFNLEAEESFS